MHGQDDGHCTSAEPVVPAQSVCGVADRLVSHAQMGKTHDCGSDTIGSWHNCRREVMAATQPRYSKEEFARRGDAIYDRDIRPAIESGNQGKFVAIDIETGAYEIDVDEQVASDRLLTRVPG